MLSRSCWDCCIATGRSPIHSLWKLDSKVKVPSSCETLESTSPYRYIPVSKAKRVWSKKRISVVTLKESSKYDEMRISDCALQIMP